LPQQIYCPRCGHSNIPIVAPPASARTPKRKEIRTSFPLGKTLASFNKRFGYLVPIIAGVMVLAYGTAYIASPLRRMSLNGIPLRYEAAGAGDGTYFIGTRTEVKSWAYRNGRMLTPLTDSLSDETGTLAIERDPSPRPESTLHIRALEWIKTLHKDQT